MLLLVASITAAIVVGADFGASVAYAALAPLPGTLPARVPVVRAKTLSPVKFYVFGDSLAFGYKATRGHGWVDEFRRRLQARLPGSIVLNSAVCGARLSDIDSQLGEAPAGDADAVLVVAGANDILFPTNPLAIALGDRAMLERVHRRYPHARVIVANVPDLAWRTIDIGAGGPKRLPFPAQLALSWLTDVDNAIIGTTAARYGDDVLDLHRLIAVGSGGAAGLNHMTEAEFGHAYISADGLHPNDRGYAMLAGFAWPAVARAARVTE